MRVLLDECVPRQLVRELPDCEVRTVQQMGWSGVKNGALLERLMPVGLRGQCEDDAAIRQVQSRQAEAWNSHDAAAYASLFTLDGDVVNVVGWWWRGRAEIESKLRAAFALVFRDSKLTITD